MSVDYVGVNLGCGPDVRSGWINVDRDRYAGALVGDPLMGLPFADRSVGAVVANHVLQMVAWPDLVPWLTEVRRVLRPDGALRLLVPDLDAALAARACRHKAHFKIDDRYESSVDGKLCMYLSQAGSTRQVFTSVWLLELLERAGFGGRTLAGAGRSVFGPPWVCELDSREEESIIAEARACSSG